MKSGLTLRPVFSASERVKLKIWINEVVDNLYTNTSSNKQPKPPCENGSPLISVETGGEVAGEGK